MDLLKTAEAKWPSLGIDPEPEPIAPPPVDLKVNTVRRFDFGDIQIMGGWLMERLEPRFPYVNRNNVAGWLRSSIGSNETFFCRTDNACAMAVTMHRTLDPMPYIETVFALARDPSFIAEVGMLYVEIRNWAARIGADQIHLARITDLPREKVKDVTGLKVFSYSTPYLAVE